MKSQLYIIGCNGIPARYGGFETFTENISMQLTAYFEISVACSIPKYKKHERSEMLGEIHRIFIPFNANGFQSLLFDLIALYRAARCADIILILGITPALIIPFFPALRKKKVIIHIDGIEWRRKKWNLFTRLLLKYSCIQSLKKANIIILDSPALQRYIPNSYQNKIRHLTYGGDHIISYPRHDIHENKALVIARAEPENNLEFILQAFELLENYHLTVISNWKDTSYGRKLYKRYSVNPRFELIGPIFNTSELQLFRDISTLYIHGHSAGGTNPSLIEAMYSGLPIIAWDNDFNRITTNNLALYFNCSTGLVDQISQTHLIDTERLKNFAMQNYKWSEIADGFKKIVFE